MEAVALAPSAMNKQKPFFHYHDGVLTATIANDYELDLVDLGIAVDASFLEMEESSRQRDRERRGKTYTVEE